MVSTVAVTFIRESVEANASVTGSKYFPLASSPSNMKPSPKAAQKCFDPYSLTVLSMQKKSDAFSSDHNLSYNLLQNSLTINLSVFL